jgi:hypothetical protein
MWKVIRITVLLLVLFIVASQALLDRFSTTGWQRTVYAGAFPVAADDSPVTARYLAQLDQSKINAVSGFLNAEAKRHGVGLSEPIVLQLYAALPKAPPALERDTGVLTRIVWSLRLRYFRHQSMAAVSPRPKIVLFLLYHDPARAQALPHSVGLQRGLSAVVHLFASPAQEAQNQIVIAHELLHTFGAKDAYDPRTGQPQVPRGLADPQRVPLYPQQQAEIMAGKMPLNANESRLPDGLDEERVGPETAREIGWSKL